MKSRNNESTKIKYDKKTDLKWQKKWKDTNLYKFDKDALDKKLYVVEMFSYPSGAQLHVGHWYNFGLTDIWARFKKLQGYNVLNPQGFDSFGLPAENYAIRTGIHPKDSTYKNIDTMRKQLQEMGTTTDWDYEVITSDPKYYIWNQWFFIQFFKRGLAYRKEAPVNWCDHCKTVLANEQVINGKCERCETEVYLKKMSQWFLKITDYAKELFDSVDDLDWPILTKKIQKNWVGPSKGATIKFNIINKNNSITLDAFTTRPDTLYGLSYVVIAPEHELINDVVTPEYKTKVNKYIANSEKKSEINRTSTKDEKTGVFTGSYTINPINGEKVPVWVADYVIASYGTGFVMAVPAHDERDYKFAKKYNLKIKEVIKSKNIPNGILPFCEHGICINSAEFSGMESQKAGRKIVEKLKLLGKADYKTTYRLRDWLISRQRYWGTPIPIIYCNKCGTVPVPEQDLPVLLPYEVEFTPTGESPLTKCKDFVETKCPVCGGDSKRETDTLDTFFDSTWYYLRYPDSHNDNAPFDRDLISKVLPVDKYVGGKEHASMHLIYARFFIKVLNDMNLITFREPFPSLFHQGTILGKDGLKMSKSKGNTIIPDAYIDKYGSDVFRMYLAFGFSYAEGGPWDDKGIESISKFVKKTIQYFNETTNILDDNSGYGIAEKDLDYIRHYTIKSITNDIERFKFNTCIARLMEFLNALINYSKKAINKNILENCQRDFIILVSPFAPHLAEEIWKYFGFNYSIFNQNWPEYSESVLLKDEIEIVIQVNGKLRARMTISSNLNQDEVLEIVTTNKEIQKWINGKEIKNQIVIPNKLVNIVI